MNKFDKLMAMVQEVNSWDGTLEYLNMRENDRDFFDTFYSGEPMEVARAVQFGDYDYRDSYVAISPYGNLVSYSDYELEELYEDYKEEIIVRYKELVEEGSIEDYHDFLSEEN